MPAVPGGPAVTSAEPGVLAGRYEHRAALLTPAAVGDHVTAFPAGLHESGRGGCPFPARVRRTRSTEADNWASACFTVAK